jgi:RNA polymerase sigma factor (sigma-70 family)
MSEISFNTSVLQDQLDRWQAGDRTAADELIRLVAARLESLARRMLKCFPNVQSIADKDDVLQSGIIRLLRTLQRLKPKNTRDFFNLAAVHIRRELLDLARKCRGKASIRLDSTWINESAIPDQKTTQNTSDWDQWVQFHEGVDRLPMEEREVVGLIFYHSWTHRSIAELLNVSERTIRRRWASACKNLQLLVGKGFFGS